MKENLLRIVESRLQIRLNNINACKPEMCKISNPIIDAQINSRLQAMEYEESLYDIVIRYIQRLNNENFFKKNGEVNDAAFYRYACIDKSTWSDIKYSQVLLKKKTLLKLIIALRLNEEEAEDLLRRGSSGFDPKDIRDQIILALIDIRCYEIEDVYEVLEEYRTKGSQKFQNIYD